MRHVRRLGGRADGHDADRVRHLSGRRQHRGTTQAVTDQQRRRAMVLTQPVGGGDQIADVGRKIGIGELAFAGTQPGEVEAQHRDVARRQALRDARRGEDVLAAGETVREHREPARPCRQIEAGRQHRPRRAGKLDLFELDHGTPFPALTRLAMIAERRSRPPRRATTRTRSGASLRR